jgi:hypothetical protein
MAAYRNWIYRVHDIKKLKLHLPAIFSLNWNCVRWQHTAVSCDPFKYVHPVPMQAASGWWKHLNGGVGSSVIVVVLPIFDPNTSTAIWRKTVTAHNCCICKDRMNDSQFLLKTTKTNSHRGAVSHLTLL